LLLLTYHYADDDIRRCQRHAAAMLIDLYAAIAFDAMLPMPLRY